jgi:putative alpha-1,2-mannosidase
MIGSPLFTKMTLRLANGKTFTVEAENNSEKNVYVQSATLDGKTLHVPVITYDEILQGATLNFVLGPEPSHWAADWRPLSIEKAPHAGMP